MIRNLAFCELSAVTCARSDLRFADGNVLMLTSVSATVGWGLVFGPDEHNLVSSLVWFWFSLL